MRMCYNVDMKKTMWLIILILANFICGFTSLSSYRKDAKEDYLLKPQYIVTATQSNLDKNKINEQIQWLMNNNQANYAIYLEQLLTEENYINGCHKKYEINGDVDLGLALAELFDIEEQGIFDVIIADFDNDKTNELCIARLERTENKEYDDIKYNVLLQIIDEDDRGKIKLSNKVTPPTSMIFEYPVFELYLGLRNRDDTNIIYCNCYGYWNFHIDGCLAELYTLIYDGTTLGYGETITNESIISGEDLRTDAEVENLKIRAESFVNNEKIPNINTIEELFKNINGDIITENNGFNDIYCIRRTPNGEKMVMSSIIGYYDESNKDLYKIYYNNGKEYVLTFFNLQ